MNSITKHTSNGIVKFSTFVEDGDLFIINNLQQKQILLGKEMEFLFEDKLKELKDFHNVNGEIQTIFDTRQLKESESQVYHKRKNNIKPI